jgi:hypothetical protein
MDAYRLRLFGRLAFFAVLATFIWTDPVSAQPPFGYLSPSLDFQVGSSCAQVTADSCVSSAAPLGFQNARDNNAATAWSSALSGSPYTPEWYAFFWATAGTVNYVTYIPRIYNLKAYHVPELLAVDYLQCADFPNFGGCQWITAKTLDLPEEMDPKGYAIFLDTPVFTRGIRLVSQKMRRDPTPPAGQDYYYFQIAELYAGDGQTESRYTKRVTYTFAGASPITCDVFGYSKKKVLDNNALQISYDFNVTQVSPTQFTAVYHSQAFKTIPPEQIGDSVSVSTSNAPNGVFPRTDDDFVVTRTSNASHFMESTSSGSIPGARQQSGGGNPILLRLGGEGATYPYRWVLFYVSVSDVNSSELHDNLWRHYIHAAIFGPGESAVLDMKNATYYSLAKVGGFDTWQGPLPRLKFLNHEPWPVRNWTSTQPTVHNTILQSERESAVNAVNKPTQGLIGNASYNANKSKVFLFTIENPGPDFPTPGHQMRTVRREMFNLDIPNYWRSDTRTVVLPDFYATKIAYVNQFGGRWAALGMCDGGPYIADLCLDFTALGGDDDSNFTFAKLDAGKLGLGPFFDSSFADFREPPLPPVRTDGGIGGQIGILKNHWGQMQFAADGTTYLYIEEPVRGGGAGGTFGGDMFSVKMKCF